MAFHLPPINLTSNSNRGQALARNSSLDRFQPANFIQSGQLEYCDVSGHKRSPSLNLALTQNTGIQSPLIMSREVGQATPMGENRFQNLNHQLLFLQSKRNPQGLSADSTPRRTKTLLPMMSLQQDSSGFSQSFSPRNLPQYDPQMENILQPRNESTFKKAHNAQAFQDQDGFGAMFERQTKRQTSLLMGMADALGRSPKIDQRTIATNGSLIPLGEGPKSKRVLLPTLDSLRREEEYGEFKKQFSSLQNSAKHSNQDSSSGRSSIGSDILQSLIKADHVKLEYERQRVRSQMQDEQSDGSNDYFSENDPRSPKSEMSGSLSQQTPKSDGRSPGTLIIPLKKSNFYPNEGSQKQGNDEEPPISARRITFKIEKSNEQDQSLPQQSEEVVRRQDARKATWKMLKQRGSIMPPRAVQEEEEKIEVINSEKQVESSAKSYNIVNEEINEQTEPESATKKRKSKGKKKTQVLNNQPNKKKVRNRVKLVMWMAVYIQLAFEDKKRNTFTQKINLEENVTAKIPKMCASIKSWILKYAGKDILAMLVNKQFNLVFVSTKVLPDKRLDKDCMTLKDQLQAIFGSLVKNLSSLSKDVFKFLASLSKNGALLPSFFFSEFELNRLQCGYFGTLKQVTIEQANLICGGIAIIRVLIHTIIMEPWVAFNMNQEKFDIEKMFNVGSVMYNIAMELLRSTANLVDSQQPISVSYKVQPKKKLLAAFSNPNLEKSFVVRKDLSRDGEVITGFYSKQQLACFFSDRKRIVQELKEQMQELLDGFYEKTSI